MHAHSCLNKIVIVFLVSSLILPSPNELVSVEARNLVSSNGVFKVNLIHRDSPLSPYYNSSLTLRERVKRAPLGSISRSHNIHLSSAYYDTNQDDEKLSALVSKGGEYLIAISFGTPPVEFLATADTGSNLIWIPCSLCDTNTCLSQESNPEIYHAASSSTFNIIPCSSPNCIYQDITTGCDQTSSSCVYQAHYGGGTQSTGVLATETISFPSPDSTSKTLQSSIFGCGLSQQGPQNVLLNGIVGLGTGSESLISQLGSNINYKFSYCLAPLSSGVTSKLTFGADVTGPGVVSSPFEVGVSPIYYTLSLAAISVGDQDNSVQVPVGLDMIIDSGTTYTLLPSSIYESVKSALQNAIALNPVASPIETLDLCYDTTQSSGSGAQFNPPDVVFHFKGADVVLKPINTFRDIGNDVSCLAMIATSSTLYIFGNIAQINFEIGYDLQAKMVSFAPTDCASH
ncbi:hypothetical protein BVRB_6g149230 [Beta vulgaris subsp. vulgaris]|nr:hypothetical protein BVRB_6g149230 [Beta vulgaris subsp. vulgaris]